MYPGDHNKKKNSNLNTEGNCCFMWCVGLNAYSNKHWTECDKWEKILTGFWQLVNGICMHQWLWSETDCSMYCRGSGGATSKWTPVMQHTARAVARHILTALTEIPVNIRPVKDKRSRNVAFSLSLEVRHQWAIENIKVVLNIRILGNVADLNLQSTKMRTTHNLCMLCMVTYSLLQILEQIYVRSFCSSSHFFLHEYKMYSHPICFQQAATEPLVHTFK